MFNSALQRGGGAVVPEGITLPPTPPLGPVRTRMRRTLSQSRIGRMAAAAADPEAGLKGHTPPAHRRRGPLIIMCTVLGLAALLGATLLFSHGGSGGLSSKVGYAESLASAPGAAGSNRSAAPLGSFLVEFTAPGLFVRFRDALDINFPVQPEEKALLDNLEGVYQSSHATKPAVGRLLHLNRWGGTLDELKAAGAGEKLGLKGGLDHSKWPSLGPIQLMVAVTSSCCSVVSLERRVAIRNTWGALIFQRYPQGIQITFFLAQPEDADAMQRWMPELEKEARTYGDTVILRGRETYDNLPNKVFRMLRFTLAHPSKFTHVLKTDDDTWVRMHRLIAALHDPAPESIAMQSELGGRALLLAESNTVRKEELHRMSQSRGRPVVSEGMTIYDASDLINHRRPNSSVDDIDGSPMTMEEVKRRVQSHFFQHQRAPLAMAGVVPDLSSPRMRGVYLGCVEVASGFHPVRDPGSKWFVSEEELPDEIVPWGQQYLAGWGYVLSRDLMQHLVQKVNTYERRPQDAPRWFALIKWEDVQVGLLLADAVLRPHSHSAFRPAWRSCIPDTAVRHLDVDSPRLLAGLVEQDWSGLADEKPVQCSSGLFLPGDYAGWAAWKAGIHRSRE